MGAFILCWLPFFIWYVLSTITNAEIPKVIVHIVFWVGYLNSAMNPIIYAYFNREFREAFKETLRNIFCRCCHLKCLESQRNDAISFSCTYRSTMDVGLVENKYVKDWKATINEIDFICFNYKKLTIIIVFWCDVYVHLLQDCH